MKHREKISHHVVCINNAKYPASLEFGKIYTVLPDVIAKTHEQIRIIDESGEDYLYPANCFLPIHLPHTVEKALKAA